MVLVLGADAPEVAAELRALSGVQAVKSVRTADGTAYRVRTAEERDLRPIIYDLAREQAWPLQELRRGDRARGPPAHVLHVRNPRFEMIVIDLAQRQIEIARDVGGQLRIRIARKNHHATAGHRGLPSVSAKKSCLAATSCDGCGTLSLLRTSVEPLRSSSYRCAPRVHRRYAASRLRPVTTTGIME